jgi:hypothetical protein
LLAASVFLLAISALFDLIPAGAGAPVMLAGFALVLVHGSVTIGRRNTIAFIVITVVISFAAEAIGVATGIVFGDYHYTDDLGFKILGVPPLVQIAYVAMAYASLMTARLILDAESPRDTLPLLAVTLVGALVMVGWDVAMDPLQSTASGDWVWEQGGAYFGVPLHNYLGWFVTVFVFLLVYGLWERRGREPETSALGGEWWVRAEPTVYYGIIALGVVLTPVLGWGPDELARPENYPGTVEDLEASMALVAIFTMGGPTVLALLRLALARSSSGA